MIKLMDLITEAKKPVSFKLAGVTFGKDYQGLKSRNGGIRYYYQKGTGSKNMESDFGKFIVKVGGLVSSSDKNKVAKKLKEGKLTEGKETLVATGKDNRGKKIEMFKTVRWGGMVTHILKSNGKEFDQYAPNLKDKAALNKFKKDYKNIKIEK